MDNKVTIEFTDKELLVMQTALFMHHVENPTLFKAVQSAYRKIAKILDNMSDKTAIV